jgi:hypothetical protein
MPTRAGGRLVDRRHPTAGLVTKALGMAIQTRTPTDRRHHPLRSGVQFASWAFTSAPETPDSSRREVVLALVEVEVAVPAR